MGNFCSPHISSLVINNNRVTSLNGITVYRSCIDCSNISSISSNSLRCHRIQPFQVFGQAHFQIITSVGCDSDIVIGGQLGCIGNTTDDIDLFIQLLIDNGSRIAAVLHAVIHGSYGLGMAIVVFIDNAVNAVFTVITVCSIHTVSTFDYMDICGSTVFAVDADMAVSTVSSIFARRRNGNAVLAVFAFDADGTVYSVFAVSTFTADRNRISLQILIQADNHIPIIINHGLDIGGIILGIRFCAGSFDGHGTVQFFGHRSCISSKLQSII